MPKYVPETTFRATEDSTLVYNLRQDGWDKGEPRMINDIAISIQDYRHRGPEVVEEIAHVIQQALNKHFA